MSQMIPVNAQEIETRMIALWEQIAGRTMMPASPERATLAWAAAAIWQVYERINYAVDQNFLSTATGENLDRVAEIYGDFPRPQEEAAIAVMVFYATNGAPNDIVIPRGTMVSDGSGNVFFTTNYNVTIPAGATRSGNAVATCTEIGEVGNGFIPGQINTIQGSFPGVTCANIGVTNGGRDVMTDDEYRAYIKEKLNGFSVAGPRKAYEYIAYGANERVSDVCVVTPHPGEIIIYALIDGNNPENGDPTPAPDGIKGEILAACNADTVRPLTDFVSVGDPHQVNYAIELTYYVRSDATQSASEIREIVSNAIHAYKRWQQAKFGRDINPSKLTQMLMDTGVLARVDIIHPTYEALNDGSDGNWPDYARCTVTATTDGGVEDE